MDDSRFKLVCIHYQWEFPDWVPDAGKKFNAKAYVKALGEADVEAIHNCVKLEPGVYNYDTKIGFEKNPAVRAGRDFLKEVVDEIERQGLKDKIKIVIYYTVSFDNSAAKHKPEWRIVDVDGNPIVFLDMFGQPMWSFVCVNSPYRDYSYAIMNEIADKYPGIISFWLDEPMFHPKGCYCKWCQEEFRKSRGYALPRDPNAPDEVWLEMNKFRMESMLRYFEDFKKNVIAKHPNLTWTYNLTSGHGYANKRWAGKFLMNYLDLWESRALTTAGFNSSEVDGGYFEAVVHAKQLSKIGRPFEITFGRDYVWMDQRIRPEHELRTYLAIALAHGGGILIGDGPYPDGRTREDKFTWIERMNRWKHSIEDYLYGAESLSEAAIFSSWDAKWVKFVLDNEGRYPFEEPMYGFAKLLGISYIQFDIISELNMDEFSKYRLIILPDQPYLSDEVIRRLEDYVKDGGNILATYRTSLYNRDGKPQDFGLARLLGLHFKEFSQYKGDYITIKNEELKKGLHPMPLLVFGGAVLADVAEADVLADLTFPITELTPETRVWFDYNPASPEPSGYPSMTLNRFGKGRCIYIAHPVEERWVRGGYWALARLLLNAIDLLNPMRLVSVKSPRQVRVFTTVQKELNRVNVHLLSEGDWIQSVWWGGPMDNYINNQSPYPWRQPPLKDVKVEVEVPLDSVSKVYEAPWRRNITWKVKDRRVTMIIPTVDVHTMISIEA